MREFEQKVDKSVVVAQEKKPVKNLSFEEQKAQKALQNKLSKIESQIQQLEKDIQNDDKELASNYDKHIENASFFGL